LSFAADRLEELLFAPVMERIGPMPLVLVPSGMLHGMPWSALPCCRSRPVSVAPSAALWYRVTAHGGTVPRPAGQVVLVAGPGLPDAAREIGELASLYPQATSLAGATATARAVGASMDGASMAHIAAHGVFRKDNPLLSCLQMADGPLTVYDLEGLTSAPSTIVLAACEAGRSDVWAGEEIMGLAGALFALGTRTLVASVAPVPDRETRPLMLAFHAALLAGDTPARALRRAGEPTTATGVDPVATSFVCFGAG
jgi:hypothetical protein